MIRTSLRNGRLVVRIQALCLAAVTSLLVGPPNVASAASAPQSAPLPNFDKREPISTSTDTSAPVRAEAMARLQSLVPGIKVDFDPITRAPKRIASPEGFLTGPNGEGLSLTAPRPTGLAAADPHGITKAFLREHNQLFGHNESVLDTARITRDFVTAHNGLKTTVWQQRLDGIPVFEAVLISHQTKLDELVNVCSQFLPNVTSAAERGTPNREAVLAQPGITAQEAVALAAANVGETAIADQVTAVGEPEATAEKRQKFSAPFLLGESDVRYVWLPLNRDSLRLCWEVTLTSRARNEMFKVLVDAQTGEVTVRHCLTNYISDATYRVFTSDSPSPFSPGHATPLTNQPPLVARILVTLQALNTNASPLGWINDGGNETLGNNVDAHTDTNNDNLPDLPRPQGSPFRVFDFPMDLTVQAPSGYSSAAVVQLFYLCNWIHDKLYDLGFTEAAGNFQSNNFGRGGLGNDAVQADAQDGGGFNNANFSTPSDGSPGRMQMYVFNGPNPDRDGDLDAEIIIHEYGHGLSNRRVGGGVGISALQPSGMGEGWSDFYGLTMLSESGDDVNGNYAAGAYASQLIGAGYLQNYYSGIRRYPYSTDMTKNPLTFKDADPAQADYCLSGAPYNTGFFGTCGTGDASEVHNLGEIWCMTLWEARANIINLRGWATGNQLILQFVTDGMNLSPANPTFLQARDAILQAELVNTGGANRAALWAAFAKRGMGQSATSPANSTTSGIVEAFDVPDSLQITPQILSANGPVGGPFSPASSSFTLTNVGGASLNWSLGSTSVWFTVSPTTGTLNPGGLGTNVTVTLNSVVTNLPLGSQTANIWFTNQTSGVSQARQFTIQVVGRNLFDDFEPGIDLSQWSAFGGIVGSTVLATNYGGSVSAPNSLWFGDGGTRSATTVPINTASGGTIAFYIRLANGGSSPWEMADALPGEGVALEYSINSGLNWTIAGTYDTTAYYNWTYVNIPIPAGAQSPATLFRWRQMSHSGSGFDHWALDDVTIDAGPTPPSIATQPVSQVSGVGGTVVFSVSASGTQPLSYQWRFNGGDISGATNSNYIRTNVQFSHAGAYSVLASNSLGTALSSNAILTVVTNVPGTNVAYVRSTAGLPWGRTDNEGILTQVFGTNWLDLRYETLSSPQLFSPNIKFIFMEGSDIDALEMASFLANNLTTMSNWVAAGGSLFLNAAPNEGGSFSMGFGVLLTYQDLGSTCAAVPPSHPIFVGPQTPVGTSFTGGSFGHATVSGGDITALLANTDTGRFVLAEKPHGAGHILFGGMTLPSFHSPQPNSSNLLANILAYGASQASSPPLITLNPLTQTLRAGTNACLEVAAQGSAPLSFQWRKGTIQITNETNTTLCFNVVSTNDAGNYDVVVTNNFGAVTSSVATITVYVPIAPVITQQPQGLTVPAGSNASFAVSAIGDVPLLYQWYRGGVPLSGATGTSVSLTNVQSTDAGNYTVIITNTLGSAASDVATLTVTPVAPLITIQPRSQGTFKGFNVAFSAGAIGTEPINYQWQLNGSDLPGATGPSLTVSNILPANAGSYRAVISNSVGPVLSDPALLALVPVVSWGGAAANLSTLPLMLTNAVQVSAGGAHNVALRRDGVVVAWGAADQTNVPSGLTGIKAVSAGGTFNLALRSEGTVSAWGGLNSFGQTNVPTSLTNAVAVAAGGAHGLALRANGTVVAWGLNGNGQTIVPSSATNIVAIAAGTNHSLALRADGKVFAWGLNTSGQTSVPAALTDVIAIAAGGSHSLALRRDGTLFTWGANSFGQTNIPSGLSNVVAIAAGGFHSMAAKPDGTIVVWGAGSSVSGFPQLGQAIVPALATNAVATSGGAVHSAALMGDGAPLITEPPLSRSVFSGRQIAFRAAAVGAGPLIYQWQFNGTNIPGATSPIFVVESALASNAGNYRVVVSNSFGTATSSDGLLTVLDAAPFIVTQPTSQACYLGGQGLLSVVADGSGPLSYQWRLNGVDIGGATGSSYQIGRALTNLAGNYSVVVSNSFGVVSSAKATVTLIQLVAWGAGTNVVISSPNFQQSLLPTGIGPVTNLAGGYYHSLAIQPDGRVLAWGAGTNNTGLNPNFGQSIVPSSLSNVVAVAGGYHTLALRADGSLVAWGPGATNLQTAPNYGQTIIPAAANNIISVAAGDYHSVALRNDGRVFAWGFNGSLQTNVPANATSNVIAISSRGNHVLALKNDGSLVHWGSPSTLPIGVSNIATIAVGVNHSLALRYDGTVASWGSQTVVPAGLSNVVDIAAGLDHNIALRSDGTVATWGATNTFNRDAIPIGLTNVIGIACGYYNSMAFLGDGTPLIKWQPPNRSPFLGGSATFNVLAVGGLALNYQWQRNGTNLSAGTASSYTITNAQAIDAGNYRVVVSNPFGSVTSSIAALTVLVPIGEAVDATNLTWTASGNVSWFGETNITHDGLDAAQSGPIADNQQSIVQTTVSGPGSVNFWWKVSSEEFFDFLDFAVDGSVQSAISGEVNWQAKSFTFSSGNHTLRWRYSKDTNVAVGLDAGWVDQVLITTNPPLFILQPISQVLPMGTNTSLAVSAVGASPISFQWLKDGTNIPGAVSSTYSFFNATRSDGGNYTAIASNPGGGVLSSNATIIVQVPQRLSTPIRLPNGQFSVLSGDADGGQLSPADLADFEAQVSTNLTSWTTLSNSLTLTNGMLLLTDPGSTNKPIRFYRIIEH